MMNPFGLFGLRRRMIANREAAKSGARYYHVLAGKDAFHLGLSPTECSWPLGTPEQQAWWTGWAGAFDRRFTRE